MTKLRRLDPQPADLTTHKGPFVSGSGCPARLICSDCVSANGEKFVWLVKSQGDERPTHTRRDGHRNG